ncbi:hypothetical protein F4825DRAFT_475458 [Nemania diffusa]|nr:hypothetical protein F4825DRAFT_475458 [Nemania diffusa]
MERLISATLDNVIRLCEANHYSYIVIGSGIGGGILARSLVEDQGRKPTRSSFHEASFPEMSFPEGPFQLCPMAAEFTAREPGSRLYQMVMGGYCTATWILNQVFNKSEDFTLLARTQVVAINRASANRVDSLTILDDRGKERRIPTGKATVILCAGTIDTAVIALRSGLSMTNRHVGCGLTDHDIWGTRFVFRKGHAVAKIEHQALRLQRMVRMTADPKSLARKIDCLVNITVNAPSFLGQQAYEFPVKFIDENDEIVTEKKFLETELRRCPVELLPKKSWSKLYTVFLQRG